MFDQLLSDRDVEKITGRAQSTLQKDRVAGKGIPFVRIGRLVRYRQSDINAYLTSLTTYQSTSEADDAAHSEAAEARSMPRPERPEPRAGRTKSARITADAGEAAP